ncbi:hypothetical protein CPLU01_10172 [Colletotrichum plurivorum]|uniref:ATPase AAA-type core domain-containing protein n=1 Tax=Colletotrichum plurivorum TaxID=2175906 RepID=A0A8H6K5R1_9PEZI|nr:hypothetical protein CPLU01_10172 [Colletotrichum plurivorum]
MSTTVSTTELVTEQATEQVAEKVTEQVNEKVLVEVNHGGNESPPTLQRKVTDLTSRLAELEKALKILVDEKQAKTDSEKKKDDDNEKPNDDKKRSEDEDKKKPDSDDKKKGGHKDSTADDEKTGSDDKKNDKFNCEPAWRLRYVRPKINWRTELVADDSTGQEAAIRRRSAIVVYYEYPEGSTSPPDEPPSCVLPVRIRINSYRLDKLLADVTGLTFPPLPYTFKTNCKIQVFLSHYEKLKEKLRDLEKSFASESKTTVDEITSEMLGAAPWPPESQDDSDSDDKSLENKKRDIVLLRCFIDMSEKFLKPLITLQSSISDGTLEKISFADLWFLYQPGNIVFGQEPVGSKKFNAYKVYCVTGGRPCLRCLSHAQTSDHKQHGPTYSDLKLHCYSWRYNGTRFMPSTTTKTIPMFDGEKSIKDLPYFPKQLCEPEDTVVSELVARGKRFQRCLYGHGTYNGTTLGSNPRHVNEDVFVDFKTGYEFNRGWRDDIDEVLLLPDRDDKSTWESRCSLDDCDSNVSVRLDPEIFEFVSTSAKKRQQAFNDLVLPPRTKNLLKAMVKTHAARSQDSRGDTADAVNEIDLVKGKGKGLIIFLYGPPGVGKRRLPHTALQPDRFIPSWNCVLLLDEADVYLAERDIRDLSRNGIVSVFLRNLEYYSGVLFLTSNREGLIDEAFKSRIHVALRYKAIDDKGTEQIWRNIMRKINEENENKKLPVTFDEEELVEWALDHYEENSTRRADGASPASTATWNGRQIRNAFQTAIALATYERLERLEKKGYTEEQALAKTQSRYSEIQLTREHFKTVAKVVGEFEDYLVECRGDDGERAEKELWRKDSHDPTAARREAALRTPKANGTPRSAFGSRLRANHDDDEDTSRGGFMSSPAPKRKTKRREPEEEEEEEEEQVERSSRKGGREQPKSWRSRKAKEEEVETSSDSE